jgi:hypothetical protein
VIAEAYRASRPARNMHWRAGMKVPKILLALALPSLLAFGCSSGDDPSLDAGDVEKVGEVSQAIGEASCGTLSNPQEWFNGSIPDPGVVTPASYSHSKCYKSFVTRIYGLSDFRTDIVVADARVDSKAWHGAPSPSDPPPSFPSDGDYSVYTPLPYGKADCEALFMRASLYEDGVHKRTVDAHGVWKSNIIYGTCTPPKVTFGGVNVRNTDVDLMFPGRTYTVAATYRVRDASSAATLPMRFVTPPAPCGHYGQYCCASESACDNFANCVSNVCAPCGRAGQPACTSSFTPYCLDGTDDGILVIKDGICRPCGDENELCCDLPPPNQKCFAYGTSCRSDGYCRAPTSPPQPPQIDCTNCGQGDYSACCDKSCPFVCKVQGQACISGTYCLAPGPQGPSNSVCATATVGECYDDAGTLYQSNITGTTEEGCGASRDEARTQAVLELSLSVPLTTVEEHAPQHCLYDVEVN